MFANIGVNRVAGDSAGFLVVAVCRFVAFKMPMCLSPPLCPAALLCGGALYFSD